jgi:transposase
VPHIQGADRHAVIQFPPLLDDYIAPDNPVRVIDAFVDQLDLQTLGFTRAVAPRMGRPAYHPADLLKLYVYGYLNRTRSSRLLEREAQRNVEVMWLLKQLTPDFKTIADFRKDNLQPIRAVCREFTLLCKDLDLFGGDLVAIDGSKFKAVNNRTRNFTAKKLERVLAEIDAKVTTYLVELEQQDAEPPPEPPSIPNLPEKLARLHERRQRYLSYQQHLAASGATQLSLTDPDCRSMPVSHGMELGYNVQTAVDAKHKLIVEHEVTNVVTDESHLSSLAVRGKATLEVTTLAVVADVGYYDGDQVVACLQAGITPYIAKPQTSRNRKAGLFTKADFVYDPQEDRYTCPAQATLAYRFSSVEHGQSMRYYATAACRGCSLRSACTGNQRGRRITRREDEAVLDIMVERVRQHPKIMKQRKQIVEHPFGTMKRALNHGYFLLRGLPKVRTEMSMTVLTYNLKRVLTIVGVTELLAVLRKRCNACLTHTTRLRLSRLRQRCHVWTLLVVDFSHTLALEYDACARGENEQ